MMTRFLFASALLVFAAACGPSTESYSCDTPSIHACSTAAITGGTLTNKTCTGGTVVSSCASTGIIGRCVVTTTLSSSTTGTVTTVYFTGGDIAAGETTCKAQTGGVWSTT